MTSKLSVGGDSAYCLQVGVGFVRQRTVTVRGRHSSVAQPALRNTSSSLWSIDLTSKELQLALSN